MGVGPTAAPRAAAARIDGLLRLIAEIPAALLVVVEIVVLFAGVMARYVFHAPLVWTDELASILFLWLAMLGSVIALAARRAYAADRGHRRHVAVGTCPHRGAGRRPPWPCSC